MITGAEPSTGAENPTSPSTSPVRVPVRWSYGTLGTPERSDGRRRGGDYREQHGSSGESAPRPPTVYTGSGGVPTVYFGPEGGEARRLRRRLRLRRLPPSTAERLRRSKSPELQVNPPRTVERGRHRRAVHPRDDAHVSTGHVAAHGGRGGPGTVDAGAGGPESTSRRRGPIPRRLVRSRRLPPPGRAIAASATPNRSLPTREYLAARVRRRRP